MRKKHGTPENDKDKFLDVNASMQGSLRFDDPVNLRINGKFEGTLDTKGVLIVGEGANIKANISGESITLAGAVNGNIKATKVLKLEASAQLIGDVESPIISIDEGAVLNGNISMTQVQQMSTSTTTTKTSDSDWMNVNQLAKYLEVDANKVSEWVDKDMLPGVREGKEWMFERSKVDRWIAEGKVKA